MLRWARLGLEALIVGLVVLAGTADGEADTGRRIGQATPFAILPADVKFPEGITADAVGNLYISTFSFGTPNFIVKLAPGGQEIQRTAPLGSPLLGLAFNADGDLFAADFGAGAVLRIGGGDLSAEPALYATLPCCTPVDGFPFPFLKETASPNALVFDTGGSLLVSDSFQGEVFRIPAGGCAGGGMDCVSSVAKDPRLATAGFPPFGANGLALRDGGLYVANTGNDTILRLPLAADGTAMAVEVWAQAINGADGIGFDASGHLWVCANQGDELVVLEEIETTLASTGAGVKVGRFLFKVGDFGGIVGRPGSRRPKGLLFPASLVVAGKTVYVTNLALPLTDPVGDEPEESVDLFTVVKVEGLPGP